MQPSNKEHIQIYLFKGCFQQYHIEHPKIKIKAVLVSGRFISKKSKQHS
jgi:hypothetical protein